MFSTFPLSEQPPINPLPNEEQFVSVPGGNLGLLGVTAGSSILEANRANDQMETRLSWAQPLVQSNFPPHRGEASLGATDFYIQPHGAGGHFTGPSPTKGHRKRTVRHRPRPVCPTCNRNFGRAQELKRHFKEQHMPRRRCPFCDFRWTRAAGIKTHILARHSKNFTTDMLEEIKALRGQGFIDFVDAYDHGFDLEHGGDVAATGSNSPA